ncbi:MAG: DUF1667 domain-containing protein [Clostridia bacterium]|nr:DUF1667 domain-containing protein [Clostridia bacterium]
MKITCVECPMGCEIEVVNNNGDITVTGNTCPRGKLYAENEITCPRRVLTTSVRAENGKMVSVKTDAPIKKQEMLEVMQKINRVSVKLPVKIGQVVIKDLTESINLIATCNLED